VPIALAITVAVVTYAHASLEPRATAMAGALAEAAKARGIEVVDVVSGAAGRAELVARAEEERARGWVGDPELGLFARVRELVSDGRRALERVELERAEASFARAEALLDDERALGWPGAATVRAEAARLRGVALYDLARQGAAGDAWRRASALEPAVALTEAEVRPEVVRAFRAATVRGAATAKLAVRSDRAVVEIDGVAHDGGVVEEMVAPGTRFVRVRGRGRPAGRLVDVGASGAEVVFGRADDEPALATLRERPARAALVEAARALGVDAVIAVAVGVDRGAAVVYGMRVTAAGCATEIVREAATDQRGAAEALLGRLASAEERCGDGRAGPLDDGRALVDAPGVAQPTEAPAVAPPVTPPVRPKRVWQRPWVWLGLGLVGVSAAAIGLGVGLAPRSATTTITLDASGFAQ
jgi:hypothetical protein